MLGGMYMYVSKDVLQHDISQFTCIKIIVTFCSTVHSEPRWKTTLKDVTMASFDEYVGPSPPLADNIKIIDIFWLFFTTTLMAEIVKQTNMYARFILGEGTVFEEVTDTDTWAFFGLYNIIVMGFHQLPAIHHYWSTDPNFYCPAILNHITRARFMFMWRFLHFVDNTSATVPSGDVANGTLSAGAADGTLSSPP